MKTTRYILPLIVAMLCMALPTCALTLLGSKYISPATMTHADNGGEHSYVNGFCSLSDALATDDGYYEQPEGYGTSASPYLINNAGKLWWFAKYVNGLATGKQAIHAKLTADINMEGSARGSFPGIGRYQGAVYAGTFDGQGYTISNFYVSQSSANAGLFSYTDGATIKDFKLSGGMTVSVQNKHGSVVGWAFNSTITDIHSSVNVTISGGAQQVGGFVGSLDNSTISRCRYNGTVSSSAAYGKIGGFAGALAGGKLIDCLFDGTLTLSVNNPSMIAGGMTSCSIDRPNNEITNCLMNGTINITNPTEKCGVITGYISKYSFTCSNTYYNSTTVSSGLKINDPPIENLNGTAPTWSMSATAVDPTAAGFSWGTIKNSLNAGGSNWGINGNKAEYPIPGEVDKDATPVTKYTVIFKDWDNREIQNTQVIAGANITKPNNPTRQGYKFEGWTTDGTNIVTWPQTATADVTFTAMYTVSTTNYVNGFNANGTSSDAEYYEEATKVGDYYEIDNAGKLFWFANQVNAGNSTYNAKVTADIDMDGTNHTDFPGIGYYNSANGGDKKPFSGNFDGQGHRIYNCNITSKGNGYYGSGLIAYASGSNNTIKDFTLEGTVTAQCSSYAGGALGYIEKGYTISGVTSSVTFTSSCIKSAGLAGYVSGTAINGCRFNGTVNSSASWVGGLVGQLAANVSVSNCLFDGTINSTYSSNGSNNLGLGGITPLPGGNTFSNCLVYGTITTKEVGTNTGRVFGRVDGKLTLTNVYYGEKTASGLTSDYNANGKTIIGSVTPVGTTPDWSSIKTALNNGSENWGINSQEYPVPGETDGTPVTKYTITFESNGGSACASVVGAENTEITLPTPTKTGYTFDGWDTAEDGTGTRYQGGASYTITATVTLYAQWTAEASGDYTNGFKNSGTSADADYYETPSQDASGYYLIDNGGKFFWFAHSINGTNGLTKIAANSKAKLTSSTINLEDRAFPGFKVAFTGEIDGQGNTISGLNYSITTTGNKLGVFNELTGTLKNFTIEGTVSISGSANGAFVGSLVGYTNANSKIEDVTSSLIINISSGVRYSGGIVGAHGGGTINRCRYNGTMTVSGAAYNGMGGIIGEPRGGSISNSLFDGVIDCSACTNEPIAGGIIGGLDQYCANPTVTNCFSYGVIKAPANKKTKIGAIVGNVYSGKKITLTNIYHSTDKANNETTSAVGTAAGTVDGSSTDKTGSPDLANGTLKTALNNGGNNWKQDTNYPIPGAETTYTITFNTDGGTAVDPISKSVGTTITLPTTTKTGYTFIGWNTVQDGSGTSYDAGANYTITGNATLYAQWTINQYTITFDTKGGTEIDPIVQDYGTVVTAPDDPVKAHYNFTGWDKEIPSTMPAENMTITALYTYVANSEGVYEIGSKEDFFNFVTVASTNVAANAKLVDNVDLEEETFNGFTGYTGTFDGNKKTISGYKRTFTSGSSSLGFFNTTNGATIKDFTLEGEEIYNINSACYAIGSVIGMSVNTTIDGVTSKVKMTFGANCPSGTGGIRVVGGIVGRITGGSINKCRYKGTIDLSANSGISDRFGGIVGDLGAASTISNCLFDGEIKVAATSSLTMGGILGARNNQTPTISHCLFNGKMTFPAGANISNCGPISGGTGVTASDSYYDMTGFTVGGVKQAKTAVQQSSSIERTTQSWLDICVALNAGSDNWGVETETYPVPGDKAATNYTITFNSNGGSAVDPISLPEGAAIIAPENPTWTGHTFTGWNPALPATMPAKNLEVTAQWELTSYNVNYYVDNAFYQAVPVKYSETITPLDAPTKSRYTFNGWTGFPEDYKMPANDIRIDGNFTFTANAEGIFEIGNREDYVNFVNITKTNAAANAKVIADIDLNNEPVEGIGSSTTPYTGTFDGQGHSITGYVRNVTTNTNQGGMFNYVNGATIKNFSLAGTMTVNGTGQQYGSVIGASEGTTLVEDVHSSVNVTITSTAAQIGGFMGRAGGTYNRCSYSGTVSTSTAFNKIGGFAGSHRGGKTTNCLFDGTLNVTTSNDELIAGGFTSSVIELVPNSIENCLVHGTVKIPHKTAKCGIVIGLVTVNVAISNALYTTTNKTEGLTDIGTVQSGTITGIAKDVTSYSWDIVNIMLNPATGSEGNWQIAGGKAWPQPKAGEWTHVHTYHNGFCIADDGEYEEAARATDGYYEISNAGNLWWIATKINDGTLARTTRIRLIDDINMEGEAHGQFPGFCTLGNSMVNGSSVDDWEGTAFQGIFDGNGHTISNYIRTVSSGLVRRGLFNAVYNATIRKVNIEGSITVSGNGSEAVMIGAVVGSAAGTSVIEDINSSVNLIVNNGVVRDFGGVAGALEDRQNRASVTLNRCRYNGTITLSGTQNKKVQNVGGVVGELRSAIIKNCLFDGTVNAESGVDYESVAGLVGKVGTSDNSEMHRVLCYGEINLNGYDKDTDKCGIVVGSAEKTIYFDKIYYVTDGCTSTLEGIGPHVVNKEVKNDDTGVVETMPVDQLLGQAHDMTSAERKAYIVTDGFRTMMGEPNWHVPDETTSGKYIYPFKDENHIHRYSNGFCTAGDGEYEKPSNIGSSYQIYNGGQLFWFATQFNNKKLPQDATVEIMRDIDMELKNYVYPGIGVKEYYFKGIFTGHGHKIQRYYRDIINAECTGLINYAEDATIKDFSLYGEMNFNLASIKSFHGSVVGMATGRSTMITDVFSFVNLSSQNANTRVLGGIAGRTSGTLRRSRYSGTIAKITSVTNSDNTVTETIEPMASGRQIGGIVANAREEILIEDCLFSGKILATCQEADTMRVSGILASNEKSTGVKITIKNCLFNGCLQLEHTYQQHRDGTGVKSTENGVIAGYWDSNLPKYVNNVFYLKTCDGMTDINIGYWEGKNQQAGSKVEPTEITPNNEETWDAENNQPAWNEIFKALDEYQEEYNPETQQTDTICNGNWVYVVDPSDPSTSEGIPVPGGHICEHKLENGGSAFNAFGYCEICGHARPLEQDEDGTYKMEVVADLASFRDMVNHGDIKEGSVLNAKLTQDIDFSEFDGDFGEPIGNSNFNRYLYNFDGQGYSLLNVKIITDDQYVGFFGFAGDETHDCYIHDFTISGTIEVPYDSKLNDNKPLYMGVVGKMYRGRIENVHSRLHMNNTTATMGMIGGILGCAETMDAYEVVVSKCSFIGEMDANAVGAIGGMVGETSKNLKVEDCLVGGTLHHSYEGENNTTQFGGVVGRNTEMTFKGIKNCIIIGRMTTNNTRDFVEYGIEGNHRNALCGEDTYMNSLQDVDEKVAYMAKYSGNYALQMYEGLIPQNTQVLPTFYTLDKFLSGQVCAELNTIDHTKDINYATYGQPWGQVLGYQISGNCTDGSPADAVPYPGYRTPDKRTYRVVRDADNNYTADRYFFDDAGDATLYPSDAASMKVRKIQYTRKAINSEENAGSGIEGYNSMCLPFDFTEEMAPENAKFYVYKDVNDEGRVRFREIEAFPITRGTPFIMKSDGNDDFSQIIENNDGTPVALTIDNPSGNGLYGAFDTKKLGIGYWKLNWDGSKLVMTTADSNCYPYRCYFKLDDNGSNAKAFIPVFTDEEEMEVVLEPQTDGPCYNIMGQRVKDNAKGIIIKNGRKAVNR